MVRFMRWMVLAATLVSATAKLTKETKELQDEDECREPLVSPEKLTASSQYNEDDLSPDHAILNQEPGAWAPAVNDLNQWLQVDLGSEQFKITRVATQGRKESDQWAKSYKLQYSDDGTTFHYYKEQGQASEKEFDGNTDGGTVVHHDLNPPIKARYIRFRPTAWNYWIAMRVEVYGCQDECREPLVSPAKLTASSQYNEDDLSPDHAILNQEPGAWAPVRNDVNQWLQVDLGSEQFKITRVATQGRKESDEWVKSYKLQYSDDGITFHYFKEQGQASDKEFDGNTDGSTVVYHDLYPPVKARYIRFRPTAWKFWIAMRVEVYGCQDECREPLVSPEKLTASSQYNEDDLSPDHAILNQEPGAWAPAHNDVNQWLQVDLGSEKFNITRVATQGRKESDQWAKSYKLQYGDDGITFHYYKEQGQASDKEFDGNTDGHTVVYHGLYPPVKARYIRFRPTAWNYWIAMRVEVYGCQVINYCAAQPCRNGGTCVEGVDKYTCICAPGYTGRNCSIDIDDCAGQPCQNGGTCIDGVNDYICNCVDGYTGKNCSVDIDDCADQPCQNGGTCIDSVNDYSCNCVDGYTGKDCSVDIDDCTEQPCHNGGTCVDGVNDYSCICADGYTGKNCDIDIDDCAGQPCLNGGTCVDHVNNYTCNCADGYTGENCEVDLCQKPLVSMAKLSASSQRTSKQSPDKAILNGEGAWAAKKKNLNQWLQVDLLSEKFQITRVATQGKKHKPTRWVKSYKLQYSDDGVTFHYYKEQGQTSDKEFDGNRNGNKIVYHDLNPPIKARYIRFRPTAWHKLIAMRVEVYGCQELTEILRG